jgi:hypothetical protein
MSDEKVVTPQNAIDHLETQLDYIRLEFDSFRKQIEIETASINVLTQAASASSTIQT